MYKQLSENKILLIDPGVIFEIPAVESFGFDYEKWLEEGNVPLPADTKPELTQYEKDLIRYTKRAEVKERLIAEMASDNMQRVRSGVWTVQQLIQLASDPLMINIQNLMGTLSFELAAQAIALSTNPMMTEEIKLNWISKLQAHFYLEPVIVPPELTED